MDTTIESSRNYEKSGMGKTFSPEEVRKILNSDNQEIKHLCKQVCISPKRDHATGRTFFLNNDVEILKKIKDLHDRGQKIMQQTKSNSALMTRPPEKRQISHNTEPEINMLVNTVLEAKNIIIDRVSKIIDEKLDGMDEVVVELIKCKAENEKLKQKLNQMTKDTYKLKNEVESFKPIGFGMYIKGKPAKFGSSNFTLN